jgi:hypothetical protein
MSGKVIDEETMVRLSSPPVSVEIDLESSQMIVALIKAKFGGLSAFGTEGGNGLL